MMPPVPNTHSNCISSNSISYSFTNRVAVFSPLLKWGNTDHSINDEAITRKISFIEDAGRMNFSNNLLLDIGYYSHQSESTSIVIMETEMLSDKSANIIGENGVRRFSNFKTYAPGWDLGGGEALSKSSTGTLEYFLSVYNSFPDEPSLFLTPRGNLALGWEDLHDKTIELEFFSDKIEYFFESLNIEGSIVLNKLSIDWLVSNLIPLN